MFTVVLLFLTELGAEPRTCEWFENFNIDSIHTPIDVSTLEYLLKKSGYDQEKSDFLIQGFSEGFDIGYRGPTLRQDFSKNIPFSVGNSFDL